VVRSDNGPQFISHAFTQGCENLEIEHERIPPKTPNMNAHIESFHRILEDDCLSRYEFQSYEEVYQIVSEFMKFYNEVRMHGSIQDMAPMEFFEKNMHNAIKIKEVRV
jgi:putative transposase